MAALIRYLLVAALFASVGLVLGSSEYGGRSADQLYRAVENPARTALDRAVGGTDLAARSRVLVRYPELLPGIISNARIWGDYSRAIAENMFSRDDPQAIADARAKTRAELVAPDTWLIRMPIVNAVLFETRDGLLLVDTGMAPAGPALVDAIRSVSDAPLHTVIYTHGHVDHAYGAWALADAGMNPRNIIAHEAIIPRFERYLRLRGSIAHYMSQPVEQLPATRDDIVWPTRTFRDRLVLEIGGETFVLVHHRGETDDQLYVWAADRRVLASADYWQSFIPNAGNGKRVQRHVEEWAFALKEMASLNARVLLPGHGQALDDPAEIRDNLLLLAEALQSVVDQVVAGLNSGMRKDEVVASVVLPAQLANDSRLQERYVSLRDVARTVVHELTGWWDDQPSHWDPASPERLAALQVEMAGGLAAVDARARALMSEDLRLACHLADQALLAAPESSLARQLVLDVYRRRILAPPAPAAGTHAAGTHAAGTPTQATLTYLHHMSHALP